MAIFYMNVQIIGRSAGRTATGAAAYRAGERIVDERTGRVFDYTRRQGEIESEIHAPTDAPEWVRDRAKLWNAVEAAERRTDAQVARELVVALPLELDRTAQRELIREYVQEQFVSQGMVADVGIHWNAGNPHAHIMLTMREVGPDGFAAKKCREWNRSEMLERWREGWMTATNRELERAGRGERIDHRSLEAQGLDRQPQVHLGPHSAALERQGVATEKGDQNRLAAEYNATVIDLEKARQEWETPRAEHAAQDHIADRIRAGWLPEEVRAMASLEAGAGGRQLSRSELSQKQDQTWSGVQATRKEIEAIEEEGRRLGRAEWALNRQDKALKELQMHQTPLAAVRRVFSEEARRSYRAAQSSIRYAQESVRAVGTASGGQLERERVVWQEQAKRLPDLHASMNVLMGLLDTLTRALKGVAREQEREQDDILHQLRRRVREHERDRGHDRGR